MNQEVLTNRELAALVWLAVLMVWMLWRPDRRAALGSVGSVLRALAAPKVLLPLLLYAGWLAGATWLAHEVGLWSAGLLKATLLWGVFSGVGLYFSWDKALKGAGFFRSTLVAVLGASAVVEFLVGFESFPLAAELVLQPTLAALAMIVAYARHEHEHAEVGRVAEWMLTAFGVSAMGWGMLRLAATWSVVDRTNLVGELLLPLWMSPVALIFVYWLAVFAGYESAFLRIDWKASDRSTWRQKAALISIAGVSLGRLRRVGGAAQLRAAEQTTFRGARHVLQEAP